MHVSPQHEGQSTDSSNPQLACLTLTWGGPTNPAVLVMFTTRPLVSISRGSTAFVMRTPAKKFTSMTRCGCTSSHRKTVQDTQGKPSDGAGSVTECDRVCVCVCVCVCVFGVAVCQPTPAAARKVLRCPPGTSPWESGPPRSPDCGQRGWQKDDEQKPRVLEVLNCRLDCSART